MTNVLRMVYLTADSALGHPDAHSAIMQDILGCDALRLALEACMTTLATDTVQSPPVDTTARTRGPQDAMQILRRLGQLSVDDTEAPLEPAGHSGAAIADVAVEMAQQHASVSLGDATFGRAVLLLCRPDWGCSDRVWQALFSGGSLATLPPLRDAIGSGELYVAPAAEEVSRCTGLGAISTAQLRDVAATGCVASAALWEGCWNGKMIKRCRAESAAGVLWGAWLLGAICKGCRIRRAGNGDNGTGGSSGGGSGGDPRWQLQLVGERLHGESAAQAATHLVASAVVWAGRCLHADGAELAGALVRVAGCEVEAVLGERAARGGLLQAVACSAG